jgi:hypothetical protein
VETLSPIVVPWSGGDIPFRAYRFRRAGQDMLVAFVIWDPVRGKPLTTEQVARSRSEWWALQWREVREARQHQPAQLLAVNLPWVARSRELMESMLAGLLREQSYSQNQNSLK